MKIFLLSSHYPGLGAKNVSATFLADSTLMRTKRAYFIPDWDESFSLHPVLAFRIGRLGKSIAARFAHRYLTSCAPGAIILPKKSADDLIEGRQLNPLDIAYDWAMPLGEWTEINSIPEELIVSAIDSEGNRIDWKMKDMTLSIAEFLEKISSRFTIKTGDILICPPSPFGMKLNIGNEIEISAPGLSSIELPIK